MSTNQFTAFDLKNMSTQALNFMAGIAIESAAVLILMLIAYGISALGIWMF